MNYETALEVIEGNNRYSVFIYLLFSFMTFTFSMELNTIVFLSYTPIFQCVDYRIKGTNVSWLKNQCHGKIFTDNGSFVTVKCNNWIFEQSIMKRTLVTDLNLVCDRDFYVTILETALFVGMAVGNFLGIVTDRLGRRNAILLGIMLEIVINNALPFMTNLWIIILLRLFWGFGLFKLFQGLIYLAEIITIPKRALYTNNFFALYVVAYMLMPVIAYLTKDWKLLRIIGNIPLLLYFFYYWIVESPRWLSVVGRNEEAKHSLVYIANKNGLNFAVDRFDLLKVDKVQNGSLSELFKTNEMRKKVVVLAITHSALSLCYFGLSINSHFVSTNIFLNVFLQGTVEILTGPLGWISSSRWNRRISIITFQLLTALCLMISTLLPLTSMSFTISKALLAMFGKFCLTTGYCITDMYMTEIFPTIVRSTASFVVLGTAATLTVLAPSINRLDTFAPFISASLYSTMIVLSALLIFKMLPETKDCPLPQTIYEADQLRIGNEKLFCKLMFDKDKLDQTV